ncbi:MAG: STAS domain-containing protein [Armatimonadetes bacterium]|nr:STAS domain-containing protein [Armatimonadota bacterium]
MATTFEGFIRDNFEAILEGYLALVRDEVDRYHRAEPQGFVENTRRLIYLFPKALAAPRDPEVMAFIEQLCRQRLPMGFQLGEVLEAMFLYDDVMLPIIQAGAGSADDKIALMLDAQRALEVVALRFCETFVSMQMTLFEKQRLAVLELSTPVIKVWDGILALPLIGTLDSYRAKQVMEELLREVSREQADIVLIDITGVPVVDTNVADHLIRTIKAVELLGTQCLVVGIGPELAQTVVSLGVDLSLISPCADMRQGLTQAFLRLGLDVVPRAAAPGAGE